MSADEAEGATGGLPRDLTDGLSPGQGKAGEGALKKTHRKKSSDEPVEPFKTAEEEARHWRSVAYGYKAVNSTLVRQYGEERDEVIKLRRQIEMGTDGGTASSNPPTRSRSVSSEPSRPSDSAAPVAAAVDVIPKLTIFTGEEVKGDYPYMTWRFDVQQLILSGYSEKVCKMAVVRSCRKTASTALQSLGDHFSVYDVISAFDKRFAPVATTQTLLSDFYNAKQRSDESIITWGCRLESLLSKPQTNKISPAEKESMLRERFWKGIKSSSIRGSLRHRLDGGATYEELLVAAREVEAENHESPKRTEHKPKSTKKATVSVAQTSNTDISSMLGEILRRVTALEERIPGDSKKPKQAKNKSGDGGKRYHKRHHKKDSSNDASSAPPVKYTCFKCGKEGHFQDKCPNLNDQ